MLEALLVIYIVIWVCCVYPTARFGWREAEQGLFSSILGGIAFAGFWPLGALAWIANESAKRFSARRFSLERIGNKMFGERNR